MARKYAMGSLESTLDRFLTDVTMSSEELLRAARRDRERSSDDTFADEFARTVAEWRV